MYNNSYKGFGKKKRSKYKGSYGTVNRRTKIKREKGTTHLQVIRVIVAFLIVGIIVGGIIVGFCNYDSGNPKAIPHDELYINDTGEDLLTVVNRNNPLESSYVPQLAEYEGYSVSLTASKPLENLLEKARKSNIDLTVTVGYISYEDQERLYRKEYDRLKKSGNYSDVKAQAKAETTVPKAGCSEFQTGLTVSFATSEKSKSFENTKAYRFLERNCVESGFVLRYPQSKKSSTQMEGSYCIFRYVGKDNAAKMYSMNMCLEEYSSYLKSR